MSWWRTYVASRISQPCQSINFVWPYQRKQIDALESRRNSILEQQAKALIKKYATHLKELKSSRTFKKTPHRWWGDENHSILSNHEWARTHLTRAPRFSLWLGVLCSCWGRWMDQSWVLHGNSLWSFSLSQGAGQTIQFWFLGSVRLREWVQSRRLWNGTRSKRIDIEYLERKRRRKKDGSLTQRSI
jgi:hypothetical protein